MLLSLPAVSLSGRQLQLEEARQLEIAGDRAAAARLYLAWARDRAGSPAALPGFAGFLRTERSLDALVDACRSLVASMPKVPGAWPLIAESAELLELAGLDEEAAEAAADAWNRGGPARLLVRAMRLALAMGDVDSYAALAGRTVAAAGLDPLAAAADLLAGKLEQASRASSGILAASPDSSLRLTAAWNLFEAARWAGSPADRTKAAERLAELFPGSPEAAIALAAATGLPSRVSQAPSPALFREAVPPTAQPATQPAAQPATQPAAQPAAQPVAQSAAGVPQPAAAAPAVQTFALQAGAFQVRENADELVKDLARSGFEAVIREAVSQGKTVYRVFAATGLDRESAQRMLQRLSAAGYAGFVVGE